MRDYPFHTLFENEAIKIFLNSSDEVFIENKRLPENQRVQLRISESGKDSLKLTAGSAQYIPSSFNGLPGFYIRTTLKK